MSAAPQALARLLLRAGGAAPALERVFPRPAPLAIEIGFGSGEALAWWAARRPEWNFLGFELAQESVARAAAALDTAGLGDRVRLLHGDARHLLREIVPPGVAVRVLMQFPMPWPKARHAKHRLTDAGFLDAVASALAPQGRFELVTDQDRFAREMLDALTRHPALVAGPLEPDPPRTFRTRYERRWIAEGRRIWRLAAVPSRPAALAPLANPAAMDHLHLVAPLTADALRALAGRRFGSAESVREIQEVFAAADGWLLRVLTADAGFAQRFFLRIELRDGGAAPLLRVDACARPFQTPAVSALLADVRDALAPR